MNAPSPSNDSRVAPVKVFGALFTGRSGNSFLTTLGVSSEVGFLRVSASRIRIDSCFLCRYEFPKDAVESLIFREHHMLRIGRLRIIHNVRNATKYVLLVACDPEELKRALLAAGFEVSEANGSWKSS